MKHIFATLILLGMTPLLRAETGYDGWLRYAPIDDPAVRRSYDALPAVVCSSEDSAVIGAARKELIHGLRGMLGRTLRVTSNVPEESCIVLGTASAIGKLLPGAPPVPKLSAEGFSIRTITVGDKNHLLVIGGDERGVLYGVFALLRRIAQEQPISNLDIQQTPYAPIRYLNHWDNLNGTIERGYAGKSVFWDADHVTTDLDRVHDYARLMASVGINGCSINNVNADPRVVSAEYLPQIAKLADAFRPWGVRMMVSLDFASPRKIGGIDTFDPLDPRAVAFWKQTIDRIYAAIPDLAGCVLKADSEGRLGPSEYGRTHADAANVIARALKPHGGVLFYRGFVYNNKMDWRDLSLDRAKAAYDNFHKLDGAFDDNVIIQIKHGPIDFQVREPASPLFGGLEKTNQAIELQITQEYLGQQRHVCFLPPMWKQTLDFDMHAKGDGTPVKAIVAGKTFGRPTGGFVGVSNVGRDTNWLGHHLAMANLYGFGRLAWNPDLSSEEIASEWTRQTFGNDPQVVKTIDSIQLQSWPAYEHYTGPLGAGTLTEIIGIHYGAGIESSEYNGWGQWHRANETGIGMDRTIATGTKYIAQYSPPIAKMYESLESCPDELLLFMHHVPYTHVLHSGKTVIQHIYDSHYQGVAEAEGFVRQWKTLKGKIDEQRYKEVLDRLEYQAGHAHVWRDAICQWFLKKSEIPDGTGRAGHYPNRIEAESMTLHGYGVIDIRPWEDASAGKAIAVTAADHHGKASFTYSGKPGWFDLRVQYFDPNDGVAQFKVSLNGQPVDAWLGDDTLPSRLADSHTSKRRLISGLALRSNDEITIEGISDRSDRAAIDYVEIVPHEE